MVVDFIVFFKELLMGSQNYIGESVLCFGISVYSKADGFILPPTLWHLSELCSLHMPNAGEGKHIFVSFTARIYTPSFLLFTRI